MPSGSAPIPDSAWLLRRIPENAGPTERVAQPSFKAFRPSKEDHNGLSLFLEDEVSAEALCQWGKGKVYFVGRIQAKQLLDMGLTLTREHDPERPGHVVVPGLNAENRKTEQSEFLQHRLAQACRVVGPLPGGGSLEPA